MKSHIKKEHILRHLIRESFNRLSEIDYPLDESNPNMQLLKESDGPIDYVDVSSWVKQRAQRSAPVTDGVYYAGDRSAPTSILYKHGSSGLVYFPAGKADKEKRDYSHMSTDVVIKNFHLNDTDISSKKSLSTEEINRVSVPAAKDALNKLAGLTDTDSAPDAKPPADAGVKGRRKPRSDVKEMQELIGMTLPHSGIWDDATETAYEKFLDTKSVEIKGASLQNIKDDWQQWGPKITQVYQKVIAPPFANDTTGVIQLLRMLNDKDRYAPSETPPAVSSTASVEQKPSETPPVAGSETPAKDTAAQGAPPTPSASGTAPVDTGTRAMDWSRYPDEPGKTKRDTRPRAFALQNEYVDNNGAIKPNTVDVLLTKRVAGGRDFFTIRVADPAPNKFILVPVKLKVPLKETRASRHWSSYLMEASNSSENFAYVAVSEIEWAFEGNWYNYGPTTHKIELVDYKESDQPSAPADITLLTADDANKKCEREGAFDSVETGIVRMINRSDANYNPVRRELYHTKTLKNAMNDYAKKVFTTF
jgi:hypothetical protein